ncbi:LANO_0B00716g1_1 [Lachancea nothofagi CBS 11611]|uniref:LANO_0B00716g1_1 n=1 Tax=Lachancea nothofagi CBS 11611 TaxID=1266666 RepID=A0A1G4IUT1_9SACH|nr:LANO_0B00716g1_1 [Lachancea nothofagi CBS 11611]
MTKVILEGGKQVLIREAESGFSYLSLVDQVDVLPHDYIQNPHFKQNVYVMQSHDNIGVGYVLKSVAERMINLAGEELDDVFEVSAEDRSMRFKSPDFRVRNDGLNALAMKLRDQMAFECLLGWRNEFYAVYANKMPYVLVERAMSGLLGIVTYGVHVNGFVRNSETGETSFWIPRRSATKTTWPYMLDNIVAGGLGYPHGIYETVVKESLEEANLPKDVIESHITPVGAVSYFYYQTGADDDKFQTEASLITGEVEYLYDLELPPGLNPSPNDDEVDSFQLLSLQETINALKNKEFKPNCALIMLEFFIRHGYINSENEPNYLDIITRIHRKLPFPTRN